MTRAPSTSASAIERARRLRFCASVSTILSGSSGMSSPEPSRRPMTDERGPSALDQQHRKEREQIQDREREHPLGGPLARRALPLHVDTPRQRDHGGAADNRANA